MSAASELIPPALRARLRDLRLVARQGAGASGFGLHRSRQRGAGLEFAQYRGYEQGDELRQVDWKLYARSDRFFVREAERDSPLEAWLLLDASASMAQADEGASGSRFDAARTLAACTIELALRQGDRFGLALLGGSEGVRVVPAGSGPRQRDRCLLELLRARPAGSWPAPELLLPLWQRISAGALVLLLGDLFDESAIAALEQLAAARREVLALQLLTVAERDFPLRGGWRFVDPESGAERRADAASVRAGFLERFGAAQARLAARLAAAGIRLARHVLDQPPDAALRQLFGPHAGRAAP